MCELNFIFLCEDLIYGMKDSAKKEKTLELRARKDYENFKIKYEKYVASAVQWKKDIEKWTIEHEDDNLEELTQELRNKDDECKRLKQIQRMIECSNETLQQRIIIASKEKDSLRKEFSRSIIDVQKRMSMNRFVNGIRTKAAKRQGDLYESLADNVEKDPEDTTNYFGALMSSRESDLNILKAV